VTAPALDGHRFDQHISGTIKKQLCEGELIHEDLQKMFSPGLAIKRGGYSSRIRRLHIGPSSSCDIVRRRGGCAGAATEAACKAGRAIE
jgi:hypothetical protein